MKPGKVQTYRVMLGLGHGFTVSRGAQTGRAMLGLGGGRTAHKNSHNRGPAGAGNLKSLAGRF